ncbi:MAG TPA: ABC transporter ATP-binding protein [Pseudolabrys sp.]|nr:ABC transporter ATP-binding protein [Pseudolabrys sp.]
MAYLQVRDIAKRYGAVTALAGVSFAAEKGDIVALLGPSGCGKTTLLNLIAGFFAPDAGDIQVAGRDLAGVPPHRREMAMVFQSYALFPHMTVADNVGFGLASRRMKKSERTPLIAEALAAVRLADYGERYPAALSGGQQQRVALARALVLRPSLLLMDEPLSNLDTLLRKTMREEVRDIIKRTGVTAILVTHDQEEALAVADRILLMNGGRIEQEGAPEEIYERPRTVFGARFMETTNFIPAQAAGRAGNALVLDTPIGRLHATHGEAEPHGPLTVSVRPERIRLADSATSATPEQNRVTGTVRSSTYLGTLYRLHVAVGEEMLVAHVPVADKMREGDTVHLTWPASETLVLTGGEAALPAPPPAERVP